MGAHGLSITKIPPADNAKMSKTITDNETGGVGKKQWLKRLVPLLTLLLVIAVSVGLFVFTQRYPEKVEEFETYGYLGAFIICVVSNATVILPVPGILVFIPLIASFNPVLLGLVGATGGIIGEITGYMAGYSGRGVIQNRPMFNRVEHWMRRWGAWAVFIFAVTPFLLLDIAGMVAGVLRYPLWKFLLVAWAGKTIKYIGIMVAAAWGWEAVLRYFG